MHLEIACFNSDSAILAAQNGADRIELCANYSIGGVTPSLSSLKSIHQAIPQSIKINVMIRPRGGDFNYTPAEFATMKEELVRFKEEGGVSGFVFGILDAERRIDVARNRELVDLAGGLPCTFHRAFDAVPDLFESAERVVECGFGSILTSGGEKDALGGMEVVRELQERYGGSLEFILGGGVRSRNLEVLKRTGVRWFHSAAIGGDAEREMVDGEEVQRLRGQAGDGMNDVSFGKSI
jgi:copper homeostasis protein